MITFKKTFDFDATDNELGDYISLMTDIMEGDVDPKVRSMLRAIQTIVMSLLIF